MNELPMPDLDLIKQGEQGARDRRGRGRPGSREPGRLLTDAEIAEDHVEQVFDIDGAGDAAEAAQRKTQVFRAQLWQRGGERSPQRSGAFLERLAVTRPGQHR